MEIEPQDVRNYVTSDGREPYEEWINSLRNRKTRAIIRERINHLHLGNFGDYKAKEYWEELRNRTDE